MRGLTTVALALAALVACNNPSPKTDDSQDSQPLSVAERLGLTDLQQEQILTFVNDCAVTLDVLDDEVPLDADTAQNIVRHRDGVDGFCGNADDDPFDDLDELDAVPQVGDASILSILAFVEAGGSSSDGGGTWEGVTFTAAEVAQVLAVANEASFEQLDVDADLDSDTVGSIIEHRPFPDMDALAETPEVGPGTLQRLKDYAPSWPGTP